MEKIFADGFSFREKHPNAPDFVIGSLYVHKKAIKFIETHANERGWVNMQIKQSKNGTYYIELDTYGKKQDLEKDEMPYPDETEEPF